MSGLREAREASGEEEEEGGRRVEMRRGEEGVGVGIGGAGEDAVEEDDSEKHELEVMESLSFLSAFRATFRLLFKAFDCAMGRGANGDEVGWVVAVLVVVVVEEGWSR